MIKVVKASEMAKIEKEAILKGASFTSFMKKASFGIYSLTKKLNISKKIVIFLGKGNNAEDAILAGIHFLKDNFSVRAYLIFDEKKLSSSFKKNIEIFKKEGGKISHLKKISVKKDEIIIDGIFGIGFKGSLSDKISKIIKKINSFKNFKISIDVPSGVNADTGEVKKIAFSADMTLYMQLPKTGFFLNQGWNYVGKLKKIDFGLKEEFIKKMKEDFFLLNEKSLPKLPEMKRTQNKYDAGYVIGIGGSPSMEGAGTMSSISCLKSGAGIVKLFSTSFACDYPEIIKIKLDFSKEKEFLKIANKADSIFIGPGIGRKKDVFNFLQKILPKIKIPCVLDADALYFLSKYKCKLPKKLVMTPHRKEMLRLLGEKDLKDEILIKKCQRFSNKYKTILVLKGGPTFIFSPQKNPIICTEGSKGMATAGTGDVLTGIIASFLSKMDPLKASLLGVYIHGYAGEIAEKIKTPYPMIAQDVIDNLFESFKKIINK